jgi:hypothetical protein
MPAKPHSFYQTKYFKINLRNRKVAHIFAINQLQIK